MVRPRIADLVKYLRDIYEAGLRSIKYDAILQDIRIPDYLARFWLNRLEKNGYVKIWWGVVILKDKLARYKKEASDIKENNLVVCPSCFNIVYEHEIKNGKCPKCNSEFLPFQAEEKPEIAQ